MTHPQRTPETTWRRLRLAELPVGGVITLEELELLLGGLVAIYGVPPEAEREWRVPIPRELTARQVIVADGQDPFTAQFGPPAQMDFPEARFQAEWWENSPWLRERMPPCRIRRYRRVL